MFLSLGVDGHRGVCLDLAVKNTLRKDLSLRFVKVPWLIITSSWIVAPGDVSPGHMMLAPESTNFIAPLSALSLGIMSGY